ncbi:hypothetical protein CCHL11_02886 [Colletotrichum chlorophyti]|uniref:Uncharacterized protein n=1 Tax=Colletotrichum chlorophyti TaxID=708187 RepID=A0A1Q8S199_9PEZI|nr:hypothetical protein CCHL11_02886 [Colletotrichum chlorophyti]
MPSIHCQRAYGFSVTNGASLVLVIPASPMVKLLRSERASVVSEAAVLRWLAAKAAEQPLLQEQTQEPEDSPNCSSAGVSRGTEDWPISSSSRCTIDDTIEHLQPLVPALLAHTAAVSEVGLEYNLLKPTLGDPVSELGPPLSASERRTIDFQIGQFYRQMCKLVSPTGRFGPAFAVLPPAAPTSATEPTRPASTDLNARLMDAKGVQSWTTAFHSMLEALLRDGEDMQVMLGYNAIRRNFKRFEHALDAVKTPRLVAVDIGRDPNTLALRKPRRTRTATPPRGTRNGSQGSESPGYSRVESDGDSEDEIDTVAPELRVVTPCYPDDVVVMTGMKDWSNVIFGDPLFAITFNHNPSDDFLKGFIGEADLQSSITSIFSSDMVEDKEKAHVRLLLYNCYHTITQILKGYFRRQRDSSGRELEARKKLNDILAQLDALDDSGRRIGKRPSGE